MQIVLWVIVSLAFLGSIFMFIPSVMSIASPKGSLTTKKDYSLYWVSRSFCYLVICYPIMFLISVCIARFYSQVVIYWLVGYVVVLFFLFMGWNSLDTNHLGKQEKKK
ncbi:MAG: hypothetical protein LBE34_02470 [Flavobacteriaceae bacterium]|jgi:Ca2+/Na+ antiporter|nr:hypothetical protein [Flavobacteriaceae bacterium]